MLPELHIGPLALPSFWVMAFLAFVVGSGVVWRGLARQGEAPAQTWDLVLLAYVGGWIGAKVFLIPGHWATFTEAPVTFLISSSGWVWYGGVAGGALAVGLWGWRHDRSFLWLADLGAPALAIGQAFGRLGCQLAGDGDYGPPTDLPWGMAYPNGTVPTTEIVHPTPVYEMIGLVLIAAYTWRVGADTTRPDGAVFARYLVLAGALRFATELVRTNPAWLLGLTTAQWTALGLVAVGAVLWRR